MASGPTNWSARSSTPFPKTHPFDRRTKPTVAASLVAQSSGRFDEAFLRKLEALAVVAKKARGGDARAERRSRRVGAGIEFADHREYAPGDDVRSLDWNLYARMDRPFVRLREEDEDLTLALLVDGSASMGLGTPAKTGTGPADRGGVGVHRPGQSGSRGRVPDRSRRARGLASPCVARAAPRAC